MQAEAWKLNACERNQFFTTNWRFINYTPKWAIVLQCKKWVSHKSKDPATKKKSYNDARSIDDARQSRQKGWELLLDLFTVELRVCMLQTIVRDEICGASQIRFFGWLLHEVEWATVHDSWILAQRYFSLERPRAVLYPPRRRFWREIFHLYLRWGILKIIIEHDDSTGGA